MVGEDKVKASFGCCEKSGGETAFTTIALPLTSPFQLPHHVTAMQHCTASPAPFYKEEGEEEREKIERKRMKVWITIGFSHSIPPPNQHKHECVWKRERESARAASGGDDWLCYLSPRSNLSDWRFSRRVAQWMPVLVLDTRSRYAAPHRRDWQNIVH